MECHIRRSCILCRDETIHVQLLYICYKGLIFPTHFHSHPNYNILCMGKYESFLRLCICNCCACCLRCSHANIASTYWVLSEILVLTSTVPQYEFLFFCHQLLSPNSEGFRIDKELVVPVASPVGAALAVRWYNWGVKRIRRVELGSTPKPASIATEALKTHKAPLKQKKETLTHSPPPSQKTGIACVADWGCNQSYVNHCLIPHPMLTTYTKARNELLRL